MTVGGCDISETVILLAIRIFLLVTAGWGIIVLRRLLLRGKALEFPIVPPKLVRLTAAFLALCFATTTWITAKLLLGDNPMCATDNSPPIGAITAWERTTYGWAIILSLACTLWIINIGLKSYRQGPRVDPELLDAIIDGMAGNTNIEPHAGAEE